MSKYYNVEIQFTKPRWVLVAAYRKQTDALHHVKENAGERYPIRIVRVVRTVVFDGTK